MTWPSNPVRTRRLGGESVVLNRFHHQVRDSINLGCGFSTPDWEDVYYYCPYAIIEEITDTHHPNFLKMRLSEKPLRKWDFRIDNLEWDCGGPLLVRRVENRNFPTPLTVWWNLGQYPKLCSSELKTSSGSVIPYQWGCGGPDGHSGNANAQITIPAIFNGMALPASSNLGDLDAWGAKGINKYRPDTKQSAFSQFVGELHDLPRIPDYFRGRAREFLKYSSKEYLNVQFGWLPFISDLKKMLSSVLDFDKKLAQLQRDSGRRVRRKGMLSHDSTVTTFTDTGVLRVWPGAIGNPNYVTIYDNRKQTTVFRHEYSFSGRFAYYLEPVGTLGYYEQIARIIGGVDLTPRLVWELLPWSWLVDWFSNVGDVISNAVDIAADSLVIDYAYSTGFYSKEITTVSTTYRRNADGIFDYQTMGGGEGVSCSHVYREEIKKRNQATPYGFGITFSGLTSTQKTVLAALGFTRFL